MLAYLILAGIVISGFCFALWLGAFALNRGINTNLETARESRRITAGQLCYGALLLGIMVSLGVIFFQMDREPILTPMAEGAPVAQSAPAPAPEAVESARRASLVFLAIFVSGLSFVLWLGAFLISQTLNTAFVSGPEAERRAARQLAFGGALLGLTLVLTAVFFQMDRSAIVPEIQSYRSAAAESAPESGGGTAESAPEALPAE